MVERSHSCEYSQHDVIPSSAEATAQRSSILATAAGRPGHQGGGPKAVLADKSWHSWRSDVAATHQLLQTRITQAKNWAAVDTLNNTQSPTRVRANTRYRSDSPAASVSDADSDDSDSSYTRRRASRLAQLRVALTLPSFGVVTECADDAAFLKAVTDADSRVHVVALLHEPYIVEAAAAREVLSRLAALQPRVQCIAARSCIVVAGGVDVVALPALLLYRAGVRRATILRVHEQLDSAAEGMAAAVGSLEALLARHGVIA